MEEFWQHTLPPIQLFYHVDVISKYCFLWNYVQILVRTLGEFERINFYSSWNHQETIGLLMISGGIEVKGYLRYKIITAQNMSSKRTLRIFLFRRKVMFRSQGIQVFVFLTIQWFAKPVTSWRPLVHETAFLEISFELQLIKSSNLANDGYKQGQ